MLRGFPLTVENNVKFLDNMWRVTLPDDCEYTETLVDTVETEEGTKQVPREVPGYVTKAFMIDNKPVVFKIWKSKFLFKEEAIKGLEPLNEWARRKGGRPKGS